MIDIHCHVLPGLDDGPRTLSGSLQLCRGAIETGTQTIVATPHVNWDYPAVTASVVHAAVVQLNLALQQASIELRVRPGAEIALSRVAELSDGELGVLGLGAGPYVLLECPFSSTAAGMENALLHFAERGWPVVLAHPERSSVMRRNPALLAKLLDIGFLTCLTAGALTGRYGREIREHAWDLLALGQVHAIASDGHDHERRPADLGAELAQAGLEPEQVEYFTREAPAAIIAGQEPGPPPSVSSSPAEGRRRRSRR